MAWTNTSGTGWITTGVNRYWQAVGYKKYSSGSGVVTFTSYENCVFRVKEVTKENRGLTLSVAQSLAE